MGSTHPTGMHSCLHVVRLSSLSENPNSSEDSMPLNSCNLQTVATCGAVIQNAVQIRHLFNRFYHNLKCLLCRSIMYAVVNCEIKIIRSIQIYTKFIQNIQSDKSSSNLVVYN